MAKNRRTIGKGITARPLMEYSGEDVGPWFRAFARKWNAALAEGGGQFGAVILEIERDCRGVLADADPRRSEVDGPEDYAARILREIELTKAAIDRGEADDAARLAVDVGCLITEAHIKGGWEEHALRGRKNAETLKDVARRANEKRAAEARRRVTELQAKADEIWAASPRLRKRSVAGRIAATTGGKIDAIRRKIIRKK